MNLFIDTNIYLTFYHFSNDDLEELKKLKVAIQERKIKLLLPTQIIEEFRRNREVKIADALKKLSQLALPNQFPQMCKDYEQYSQIREKINQYEELKTDLLESLTRDIQSKELGADKLIEELFEVATKIESTPEIISLAKDRFDIGNPPGKNKSYGDAINWELLLSYSNRDVFEEDPKDLHLLARDKDYSSPIDENNFSQFLQDEWNIKKSSNVIYYKSLSDFFKTNFPDIKLASELARQLAISNLVSSPSFARTHLEIEKVSQLTDLTSQEVNEIVEGLITNPQITRISQDPDVQTFIKKFFEEYKEVVEDSKIRQLETEYELIEVEAIPSPSPAIDDWDNIPF